jgi:hypothetical protein
MVQAYIAAQKGQGDRIWRWWLKTGVAGGGVAGL